jgi:hypothetical protein
MSDDFDLMNDEWDRFCIPDDEETDIDSSYGYDASIAEGSSSSTTIKKNSQKNIKNEEKEEPDNSVAPTCGDIYISTKTKIAYLNKQIVLDHVFWNIPIIPYHLPKEGVIKKQMKFNSSTKEELDKIQKKVKESSAKSFVDEHVIMQIVNPSGRIQFKDVRKVSIGLCKKDIVSHRCKKKSAFYNCFVIILRVEDEGIFREIHAKVFNTGKMEIPGIQTKEMLDKVLVLITNVLKPIVSGAHSVLAAPLVSEANVSGAHSVLAAPLVSEANVSEANVSEASVSEASVSEASVSEASVSEATSKVSEAKASNTEDLGFIQEKSETVLINSNFRCGYYINRDKLYSLLKYKYKINSAYDPCSYPGIQCEFYYDPLIDKQTGRQPNDMKNRTDITKVSFMIFRTGSVLIVGKCEEDVLQEIYLFIRGMLEAEYKDTHIIRHSNDIQMEKVKIAQDNSRKIKKKTIVVYSNTVAN